MTFLKITRITNLEISPNHNFNSLKSISFNNSIIFVIALILSVPVGVAIFIFLKKCKIDILFYGLYYIPILLVSAVILEKIAPQSLALKNLNKSVERDFLKAFKYFLTYLAIIVIMIICKVDMPGFGEIVVYNYLTPAKFLFYFYSISIIVPMVEEICFKRIIYVSFRHKLKFLKAYFISCITFSVFHFGIAIPVFLWSLFSYHLYEKHKSLLANIIFHSLSNICGMLYYLILPID